MVGAVLTRMMARRGCECLDARDVDRFLSQWQEDAIFICPGATRVSGEHMGRRRVREWCLTFCEQFPQSHFSTGGMHLKNIVAMTASNPVAIEWEVLVRSRFGESFTNHGISLGDILHGRIRRFEDFVFDLGTAEKAGGCSSCSSL